MHIVKTTNLCFVQLVVFVFSSAALHAQTDYYWNHETGSSTSYFNRFNWAMWPGGLTGHGYPSSDDVAHFLGSGIVTSMGGGASQTSYFDGSDFTFSLSGNSFEYSTNIVNQGVTELDLFSGTLKVGAFDGSGHVRFLVSSGASLEVDDHVGSSGPEAWLNIAGGSMIADSWTTAGWNQITNGGTASVGNYGEVNIETSGQVYVSGDESELRGHQLTVHGNLAMHSGYVGFRESTFTQVADIDLIGGTLGSHSVFVNEGAHLLVDGGIIRTREFRVEHANNLSFNAGEIEVKGSSGTRAVMEAGDFGFTGTNAEEPRLILNNADGIVGEFSAGFGGASRLSLIRSSFSSGLSRLAANGGSFDATISRDSTWNTTEVLVGHSGTANLSVAFGGQLHSVNGRVGVFGGGHGEVVVRGIWNSTSRIRVAEGTSTTGLLDIRNGGVVNTPTMVIGHSVGSVGSATIDGVGSQLNITGVGMAVGNEGTGSLSITNGGSWISTDVNVGSFGGTGTVSLSDSGSYWNNSGLIRVGRTNGAIGTLNVESHAQILTSTMVIGDEADSTGSVLVADSGLLDVSSLTVGNQGSGVLEIHGGNVTTDSMSIGNSGLVTFQSGGLTSSTIDLVGTAEFDFLGGTLSVESFASSLVQNGGTLAPGNSAGSTTIEGNYTLNGGSIEIELGGLIAGMEHDYVSTTGDLILNSAGLDVSLLNGFSLSENDEFLILSVDGNQFGFFNGLGQDELVGTFGSNRLWIDYLAGDGNDIRLYATSVPEPTSLSMFGLLVIGFCSRRKRKVSDK